MKTYTVIRSSSGQLGATVTQREGPNVFSNAPLAHCVFHSPTGFETGYSGSGPADLALSILADHFGASTQDVKRAIKSWSWQNEGSAGFALEYHQRFKEHFIAGRKLYVDESYNITTEEIIDWFLKQNG